MPEARLPSRPESVDVRVVRGAAAAPDAVPDLLLEAPHGATRAAHFAALRAELRGTFPEDLRDFFFVNTDVGTPEVADLLARRAVHDDPGRTVLVLVSRIPRTFVDCNRVIDPDAAPRASAAGELTPGLVSYVRDPADVALLLARHRGYREVAEAAYELVCGAGGTAVMLHSYAPRSLDIPVDDDVVARLHEEYRPENIGRWPLRPEADLITRDPDGRRLADDGLVLALQAALEAAGLDHAESATYPLHPSTLGGVLAARHPGRTLCIEMRRDLLAREFTPFAEMEIDPARADRFAGALAQALRTAAPRP